MKLHALLQTSQLHFNSTGERYLDCVVVEHNGFAGVNRDTRHLWYALGEWFANDPADTDELVVPGVERVAGQSLTNDRLLFTTEDKPAFRIPLSHIGGSGALEKALSRNARQKLRRSIRDYSAVGSPHL